MNRKKYISPIVCVILLICTGILALAEQRFVGQLSSQTIAKRWSKEGDFSQVSCFFQENNGLSEEMLVPIRYQLKEELKKAAVGIEEERGRNLVDAYSSFTEGSIASKRGSAVTRIVAVGGDFFLFHPMELLSGNYFDGTDVNEDGVILDEEIAWKLFGSSDVTGMEVSIYDAVCPVRGVVRRKDGAFAEASGQSEPTIYISYSLWKKQMEGNATIGTYELLINTPVTGFGMDKLKEALGMSEDSYEMVENSSRFSVSNRMKLVKDFGKRSMKTNSITYPYWENRARAYEDVATLLLLLEMVLLVYPIIKCVQILVIVFRRCKRISWKDAFGKFAVWAKGKKL